MKLYVNPTITSFRQDVDGTIKELKIGTDKEDAYANIVEQGASAKLDNNKAATIDVSTYTEPVVITPTSGKDGMKKATVTLSNIPSGGGTLYCWASDTGTAFYSNSATPADETPLCTSTGESGHPTYINAEFRVKHYSNGVITVQQFILNVWTDYESPNGETEFARDSENDISLT